MTLSAREHVPNCSGDRIEGDEISARTRCDPAPIGESEGTSRVPGEVAHRSGRSESEAHEVGRDLGQRDGRPGEGAVLEMGRIPRHLVAHHRGLGSQTEGQADHHRVHVYEIGDHRGDESGHGECGADQSGRAVVQRRHPVEEVGHQGRPGLVGGAGVLVPGGRVSERDSDSGGRKRPDGSETGIGLRRQGDQCNQVGVFAAEHIDEALIDRSYHRRGMGARCAAEERTFEVDAEDGVRPEVPHRSGPVEHLGVRVQRGAAQGEEQAAETGRAALDELASAIASGKPYQAAILDMRLPDGDGWVLGRTIRETPALAATRLVLLTAFDEPDHRRKIGRAHV